MKNSMKALLLATFVGSLTLAASDPASAKEYIKKLGDAGPAADTRSTVGNDGDDDNVVVPEPGTIARR